MLSYLASTHLVARAFIDKPNGSNAKDDCKREASIDARELCARSGGAPTGANLRASGGTQASSCRACEEHGGRRLGNTESEGGRRSAGSRRGRDVNGSWPRSRGTGEQGRVVGGSPGGRGTGGQRFALTRSTLTDGGRRPTTDGGEGW
jgi:hypothetical protein